MILASLTRREHEVMQLLDGHLRTNEVASRLNISVHTVRSHVKSALRKLDANCKQDAFRKLRDLDELTGYSRDLVPSATEHLFRNALELIAATTPRGTFAGDIARKTLTTATS